MKSESWGSTVPNGNGMHIDKSISVGHLVSMLALIAVFVGGWVALNQRVTANEIRVEEQAARQDRFEARIAIMLESMGRSLDRIETRLEDKQDRE